MNTAHFRITFMIYVGKQCVYSNVPIYLGHPVENHGMIYSSKQFKRSSISL